LFIFILLSPLVILSLYHECQPNKTRVKLSSKGVAGKNPEVTRAIYRIDLFSGDAGEVCWWIPRCWGNKKIPYQLNGRGLRFYESV